MPVKFKKKEKSLSSKCCEHLNKYNMYVHIQLSSRYISFLPGNFLPPLCVFHFSTIRYDKTTTMGKGKKKKKTLKIALPYDPAVPLSFP